MGEETRCSVTDQCVNSEATKKTTIFYGGNVVATKDTERGRTPYFLAPGTRGNNGKGGGGGGGVELIMLNREWYELHACERRKLVRTMMRNEHNREHLSFDTEKKFHIQLQSHMKLKIAQYS